MDGGQQLWVLESGEALDMGDVLVLLLVASEDVPEPLFCAHLSGFDFLKHVELLGSVLRVHQQVLHLV